MKDIKFQYKMDQFEEHQEMLGFYWRQINTLVQWHYNILSESKIKFIAFGRFWISAYLKENFPQTCTFFLASRYYSYFCILYCCKYRMQNVYVNNQFHLLESYIIKTKAVVSFKAVKIYKALKKKSICKKNLFCPFNIWIRLLN